MFGALTNVRDLLYFEQVIRQVAVRDRLESAALAFPRCSGNRRIGAVNANAMNVAVDVDGHRDAVARPVDRPTARAAQSHRVVHTEIIGPAGVPPRQLRRPPPYRRRDRWCW